MLARTAFVLFAAWLAGSAAASTTSESAAPAQRILFIGNALTYTGDLPARLARLASAMGRSAIVDSVAQPGFSLRDHWEDGRAAAAIGKGWDIVVLQQDASADGSERASLLESARRFASAIRAAGARPALFMAWPPSDRMQEYRGAIASHREAAKAVDGVIVPVGEAWLRAMSGDRRVRLYSGATQANSLGLDLAVLTLYFAFFPAGPQEFDDAFVARLGKALDLPPDRRDLLVDAATRAIDEPMALQ